MSFQSFGLNFEDEGGIWCSKFSNCCNFVSRLEIFEKFRNWHSGLLLKYIASFWFLIFLKFIWNGKASKFEKIFHLFFALHSNVKTKRNMFSNFCSLLRILELYLLPQFLLKGDDSHAYSTFFPNISKENIFC